MRQRIGIEGVILVFSALLLGACSNSPSPDVGGENGEAVPTAIGSNDPSGTNVGSNPGGPGQGAALPAEPVFPPEDSGFVGAPPPCDSTLFVARFESTCSDPLPVVEGYEISRLHGCQMLQKLRRRLMAAESGGSQELLNKLEMTFLVRQRLGGAITIPEGSEPRALTLVPQDELVNSLGAQASMQTLEKAGFSGLERSCQVVMLQAGADSRHLSSEAAPVALGAPAAPVALGAPAAPVALGAPAAPVALGAPAAPAGETSRESRPVDGPAGIKAAGIQAPWHLVETGAHDLQASIQAQVCKGGDCPKIRVAVLDTGVDRATLGPALSLRGWSFDGHANSWRKDNSGHGTAVAQLIVDSSLGMAEIVSVRVLGNDGTGLQHHVAHGIVAALSELDVQLINLSLGFYAPQKKSGLPQMTDELTLREALEAAHLAGVPVLAAAGNTCGGKDGNFQQFMPAASGVEGVLSVSGLSPTGQASSQAVWGGARFFAPSEFICTRLPAHLAADGRALQSGTSFAVAQVTGAYALLRARHFPGDEGLRSQDRARLEGLLARNTAVLGEGPAHSPLQGARLDLCSALELSPGDPSCRSWGGRTHPTQQECGSLTETLPAQSRGRAFTTLEPDSSSTPEILVGRGPQIPPARPYDGMGPALWCDGRVHTSPPINGTGGEDCIMPGSLDYDMRVEGISNAYAGWELFRKVRTSANTIEYYPLGKHTVIAPGVTAGGTMRFTGTCPSTAANPREVWLGLQSGSAWVELPMMMAVKTTNAATTDPVCP